MFCRKCGTQLRDGARFCESCGTKVNPGENPGNINEDIFKKMQELNVFEITRIVVWVICAALVIMFFLPIISISSLYDFSAYELMIGKEIEIAVFGDYMVKGNALVALLVLIPLLVALFYDKNNIHLSAIFSFLGMIALVIFTNYVRDKVSEETEGLVNRVQFTAVYTFYIFFYIISGILSCAQLYFRKNIKNVEPDSNGMEFNQNKLSEYAELADFVNAIYHGMYHMKETQNFTENIDIRAEDLSSFARANALFWYQYFNNSFDKRIKTEGNKFYHYHRAAVNDLEDMMKGMFGSCTDDDMQSFRLHYITQEEAEGTFLMDCSNNADHDECNRCLKIDSCTKENGRIKLTGTVIQKLGNRTGSSYPERNFSAYFLPDERSPVAGYRFDQLIVDGMS